MLAPPGCLGGGLTGTREVTIYGWRIRRRSTSWWRRTFTVVDRFGNLLPRARSRFEHPAGVATWISVLDHVAGELLGLPPRAVEVEARDGVVGRGG
jgi:hypothetical protein